MKLRRRKPCILELDEQLAPDLEALLSGEVKLQVRSNITFLCPITGERIAMSPEELGVLAVVGATDSMESRGLSAAAGVPEQLLMQMLERGLLVCDGQGSIEVSDAEARLESLGWFPIAAVYHAASRWSGVRSDEGTGDLSDEAVRARLALRVEQFGSPPPALLVHEEQVGRVSLPRNEPGGGLWEALRKRATCRAFRTDLRLALSDLSRVLYYTFGAQGARQLSEDCVAMKRTSASGGGLHPIEPYVISIGVDGLQPGLYHYEWGRHELVLLRELESEDARRLVIEFTAGQAYLGEAHAVVFHVARVGRNCWKYRRHPKAYKVLFMDAGHLSQTFYLTAADAGLGAYFVGAVNDADICKWIGLDPLSHAVIGANGLGIADESRDQLSLRAESMANLLERSS